MGSKRKLDLQQEFIDDGAVHDGDPSTVSGRIICEGLQTIATVVLDGVELGRANNQYRRWSWPLPPPGEAPVTPNA